MSAGAVGQAAIPDPIVVAIEGLLDSDSALVRGEAALALAATGDPKYYSRFLELAADTHPETRRRALLALGLLGQPGADVLLNRVLRMSSRDSADRLLAALALGLLPDEPRVSGIDEFFERATSASRKRIRGELVCLLTGFLRSPHPQRMTVLREFMTDATYRQRPELALVIENLARVPGADNFNAFQDHIESKNPVIQIASFRALEDRRATFTAKHWKTVLRLAEHAAHAEVRAAALDLLTFHRKPEALGLAGRCLHGEDQPCVAAAVRTILALGGSSLRGTLEDRIVATADPRLQTAMLRAKKSPHGDAFVKACIAIARDRSRTFQLRVAATRIVAEAGWKELQPTATRLFLASRDRDSAASLALAIERLGGADIDKTLPSKTVEQVALFPMRLRALLRAGSRQAFRVLLRYLTKPPSQGVQEDALAAYRSIRLSFLDQNSLELLPPPLRELID